MLRTFEMKPLPLLLLLFHVLFGCMPVSSTDTSSLLGRDYLRMSDSQLVAYEQELSDELVRLSRSGSSGDVNVGVGFGSWGGGAGYGVHADKWLGGGVTGSTLQLNNRRDDVRAEMRRRHLLPQ
jgi:hypothetical protein